MAIWAIIKRTDKRIIAMLIFLFLGVSYSVYRAIDALSGEERSPEYRRSPPGAFSIPLTDTIISSATDLDGERLPDDVYIKVKTETDQIMEAVLKRTITPSDLTRLGLSSQAADNFVLKTREFQALWGKDPESEIDPEMLVAINGRGFSVARKIVGSNGTDILSFSFGYNLDLESNPNLVSVNPIF